MKSRKWFFFYLPALLTLVLGVNAAFLLNAYQQRVHASALDISPSSYNTSWLGNDLPGGDNSGQHVAHTLDGMFVGSDGTVYTNCWWEEGQMNLTILKGGQVQNRSYNTDSGNGGYDVVANANYIYQTYIASDGGGIRRLDSGGNPATFSGGKQDGSLLVLDSNSGGTRPDMAGVTLDNANNVLYASDPVASQIDIVDLNSMSMTGSFSFNAPGKLAYDGNGGLWIVQSSTNQVLHYDTSGNDLGQAITDMQQPGPVAFNNQGQLMVGEDGPDQWIRIYNVADGSPSLASTFGQKGGIFSGTPGEVQPLKFNKIVGLGTDSSGNIYVGNGASNTLIQSYSASGSLRWTASGLHFEDNAAADPGSENDVYSIDKHYVMDYSKPAGQEWTFKGYTLDPFKYPQDARINEGNLGGVRVQEVQGHKFLMVADQNGGSFRIYRFNAQTDGEVAIPSLLFLPNLGSNSSFPPNNPGAGCWIWRDANGNGSFDSNEYLGCPQTTAAWTPWMDSNGDLWFADESNTIYHYPFQGFDANGNIIYTASSLQTISYPASFASIKRLEYYPATDTMYITGYTANQSSDGPDLVGKTISRYDNWSQGNRNATWTINPPYAFNSSQILLTASMSIAGNYLFVGYYVGGFNPPVDVFNLSDGSQVGALTPTNNVLTCDVDIPLGLSAYQRSNGEYLIFQSDHCYGKIVMYRWNSGDAPPTATAVNTPTATSAPPSTPTTTPGTLVTAINAGGGSTSSGFAADTDFNQGNQYADTSSSIDTNGVSNPAPQAVYQTARWNSTFTYTIPNLVANKSYRVRLHWAELSFQATGQRIFNVAINGSTVLRNFHVYAIAGFKKALVKEFTVTVKSNRRISIAFTQGSADNPFVNGIEIYTM